MLFCNQKKKLKLYSILIPVIPYVAAINTIRAILAWDISTKYIATGFLVAGLLFAKNGNLLEKKVDQEYQQQNQIVETVEKDYAHNNLEHLIKN